MNRWLRFHAPYLPRWLPKDWLGRYYAWKYIVRVQPLTPEQIAYGQQLWEEIRQRESTP